MTKLGIMQPYFFPYLGYWQLLNTVDKYVIYDDVNYIKNGWINRNNILVNGKPCLLTLPLEGASPFLPINQIKITSKSKDKEKILKTLEMAYKKAPYFNDIYPLLNEIISGDEKLISNILIKSFKLVSEYLGIKTEFIISSQLAKNNDLKGQEKVIHICQLLGATEYINAIGGQSLYSKETFAQKNIKLSFLKMNDIRYPQFKNEFVPSLSIIDVMMFNSKEEIRKMLNDFTII